MARGSTPRVGIEPVLAEELDHLGRAAGETYGQIPDTEVNPNRFSLTELEFREARRLDRPILIFVMGENHLVRKSDIEQDPEKASKLVTFRSEVKRNTADSAVHRVYCEFDDLHEFEVAAYQSIAELRRHLDQQSDRVPSKLVYGWISDKNRPDSPGVLVDLVNKSNEPVYDVVVWVVTIQGSGPRTGEDGIDFAPYTTLAVLPPGRWIAVAQPDFDWGMSRAPGVEVGFTDSLQRHWIHRVNSRELVEISLPAPDHYGIGRPLSAATPDPYPDTPN